MPTNDVLVQYFSGRKQQLITGKLSPTFFQQQHVIICGSLQLISHRLVCLHCVLHFFHQNNEASMDQCKLKFIYQNLKFRPNMIYILSPSSFVCLNSFNSLKICVLCSKIRLFPPVLPFCFEISLFGENKFEEVTCLPALHSVKCFSNSNMQHY